METLISPLAGEPYQLIHQHSPHAVPRMSGGDVHGRDFLAIQRCKANDVRSGDGEKNVTALDRWKVALRCDREVCGPRVHFFRRVARSTQPADARFVQACDLLAVLSNRSSQRDHVTSSSIR